MATATSTIAAARTALIAAINQQPAVTANNQPYSPVLVRVGPPGTYIPEDMIIVGEQVRQAYQVHEMRGDGGQGWLQEDYKMTVLVDSWRGGDDSSVAMLRCEALVNAVDDAIRNDPSLNSTVTVAWPSAHEYSIGWEEDHKGWVARCAM